jgi:hypothetical protein
LFARWVGASTKHKKFCVVYAHWVQPNYQAPQTFTDDNVKIWAQAVSVIAISDSEIGTLFMMPTAQPDDEEEADIEFLMSVNSWIIQVTSLSSANKISATFKVIGLVEEDSDVTGLVEGQEVVDLFDPSTKMLQIHDKSLAAQSIDCLKRKRMFESLYEIPSKKLSKPSMNVTSAPSIPAALPGSSAYDSSIAIHDTHGGVPKMLGSGVVVKVSVEERADCSFEDIWTIGEALVNIRERYGLIGGTIEYMMGSDWVACHRMLSFFSIVQALELNVSCQFRFAHFQTIEQVPQQQAGQRFHCS